MGEYSWPDEEEKQPSIYSNHFHEEGTFDHIRNDVSINTLNSIDLLI